MRVVRGQNYEEGVAEGTVIVGAPKTVLARLQEQHKEIGFNYLLNYMFLGTMTMEQAMRSLKLFVGQVMPALEKM
jgi:alkanesulfonate monooxygenase SsuD/methylene tetrahydromethanopterin reductase-like flavin-dependent oxidoreductase (luciferase family)